MSCAQAWQTRKTATVQQQAGEDMEPSTCQPIGQQTPVSFSACCAAAIQTASCQTGDNTTCKYVTKKELCKRCFSKYRAVEGTEQIILSCISPFPTQKTNASQSCCLHYGRQRRHQELDDGRKRRYQGASPNVFEHIRQGRETLH